MPFLTAVEKEGYSRTKVENTCWLEDRDEEGGGTASTSARDRELPKELTCNFCNEILTAAVILPCCVVAG
jgi:hypothetical protein